MKAQTLLITEDVHEVWALLGENAGAFDDNGGDPDGNAWLPSFPLDMSNEGVSEVIEAGYGKLVYASYTSLADICADITWLAADILGEAAANGHVDIEEGKLYEGDDFPEPTPTYEDVRGVLNCGEKNISGRTWNWMWAGYLNGGTIVVYSYTPED